MARRKKNKVKKVDPGLLEFEGWELEQKAWFPMVDGAAPHEGIIKRFYPDDKIAACACLWDQTGGGYRTVPIKFLFLDKKKAKASRQDFLSFWDSFKG